MEAHRIKTIVILILAFLNLFLLGMLVRHLWLERSAQNRLENELRQLYSAQDMELAEELELTVPAPDTLSLVRDLDAEAAMASFILTEDVAAQDQGGGIYSYTGQRGTVRFRSNGAFAYTPVFHPVESPLALCRSFCETFDYQLAEQDLSGQDGIVTVVQSAGENPIYNAPVLFVFSGGQLQSISGSYISIAGSTSLRHSTVSRTTALVRFLDYRSQSGLICNEVSAIRPVYELQANTSPLRLAAKWELTTDTGRYYVDCYDATIVRG